MSYTVFDENIREKEVLSSRFIASLRHTESEEDFAKHINEIKEAYPKASHYCYGARFLSIEKMGDDGEPSHSAGLQILSALRYKKLDNVSLIVVRYFGGTKLGLPRLTRTYREAAEEAILTAKIVEEKIGCLVTLSIPYSDLERLRYQLKKANFSIKQIDYSENVIIVFLGEKEVVEHFLSKLSPNVILNKETSKLFTEVHL